MTPKSLFNIILKIIGIFFIKEALLILPSFVSAILSIRSTTDTGEILFDLILYLGVLLVYGAISYYLIFKTEWIIQKLKLENGFDESEFSLNIHRSTILRITVMVIGGLILADEIPNFCRQLYSYYMQKTMTHGLHPTIAFLVLSVTKIIIGALLIAEQRKIVNFIEYKQRNKENRVTE